MLRRETTVLSAMAIVPVPYMALNLLWPPEQYGYIVEMLSLLILALGMFWLSFYKSRTAVLIYSVLALVPVGMMLKHWAAVGGGFSVLALIPTMGVLMVVFTTRHYLTTLLYGVVAFIASVIYGSMGSDLGQTGALVFTSVLVTFWSLQWVKCTGVHVRMEFEKLQRDVREIRGMTANINQQMEAIGHDP